PAKVWTSSTGSTGGSSTDRVSAATSISCSGDVGGGGSGGGSGGGRGGGGRGGSSGGRVIVGRKEVNLGQSCCLKTSELDAAEESRITAATDVETSLLLSGREASA
ncbi:unnamed protein product, partial [Laminaria digitata]